MIKEIRDITAQKAALIAGLCYLIITVLAPIGNFSFINGPVVPDDAARTAANIIARAGEFRAGTGMLLIVAIFDIIIAWALYILLKPVHKDLSLLAAWFRIIYSALFIGALGYLLNVLQLLNIEPVSPDEAQLHSQILLSIKSFNSNWDFAMTVFCLHLLLIGYLAIRSGFIPKIFGILLIVAGVGYMADVFGKLLIPDYSLSIAMFTFPGEPLFILWLLWRGFRGFKDQTGLQ